MIIIGGTALLPSVQPASVTPRPPRAISRALLIACATIVPLVALGLAWLAVERLALTPRQPAAGAAAADYIRFISSPRGLPTLPAGQQRDFLEAQGQRLLLETAFRDDYAAALRRTPAEAISQYRSHLFAALKPQFMQQIDEFAQLPPDARVDFLDARIIEYERIARAYKAARIDADLLGRFFSDRQQLQSFLLGQTSAEERERGMSFVAAYLTRRQDLKSDPQRWAQIDARVAAEP